MKYLLQRTWGAAVVATILGVVSTRATDLVWTNLAGGSWSVAANWDPNQIPGPNDRATITNSGNYVVTINVNAIIASFTLGGQSGTQTLAQTAGTLTVSNTCTVGPRGTLTLNSGAIDGPGDVNIYGALVWQNGLLDGSGTVNLYGSSTLQSTINPYYHYLRGRTVRNYGTVRAIYGHFYTGGGCVIDNMPGGVWMDDLPHNAIYYNAYAGTAAFTNHGTYIKTNAPYVQFNFAFANEGQVQVDQGELYFAGGGAQSSGFDIASGSRLGFNGGANTNRIGTTFSGEGEIYVSAGTVAFNTNVVHTRYTQTGGDAFFNAPVNLSASANLSGGNTYFTSNAVVVSLGATNRIDGGNLVPTTGQPVPIAALTFYSGTIGGSDVINIAGPFLWQNGFFDGTNAVNLNGASTLQAVINPYYHYLRGRTVRNFGSLRATYGHFYVGGGCVIDNMPGGLWIDDLPHNAIYYNSYAGPATFFNHGTYVKTNTPYVQINFPFLNQGQVQVDQGELYFAGGGLQSSGFAVASGSRLGFNGGANTNNAGTTFAGAGEVYVSAGTVTFNTGFASTHFNQVGGDVFFNGVIDVSASGNFSGGNSFFTSNAIVTSLGATNRIDGGTLNFNTGQPVPLAELTFYSGTIAGSDTVNVAGPSLWQNGFFDGTNTITLSGVTRLQAAINPYYHYLRGRTVRNFGTVINSYGHYYGGGGCLIDNAPGATWIEDTPHNAIFYNNYAGPATFLNRGLFIKTNLYYTQFNFAFLNQGDVRVEQGELYFANGGIQESGFTIANGTRLGFNGGVHTNRTGTTFSGNGELYVSAGTVTFTTNLFHTRFTQAGGDVHFQAPIDLSISGNFSGGNSHFTNAPVINLGATNRIDGGTLYFVTGQPVPFNALTFYSGTIAGTDTIDITGPFLWQNGFFDGSGVVNLLGATVLQSAVNPYYHYLRGRTIRNHATARSIYGSFYVGGGCVIENLPGATWIEDVPYDVTHYNSYAGTATFLNRGTYLKTNASYAQWLFPFHNENAVGVQQGTLYLTGGGTHVAEFNTASSASLVFNGGSNVMNAGSSFTGPGTILVNAGSAEFNTTVDFPAAFNVSGGTANFNPSCTINTFGVTNYVTGGVVNFNSGEPVPINALTFYSGTIAGSDPINISGPFLWQNGFFDGSGVINLLGTSTLQSAFNPYYHYLRGRTVRNHATTRSVYGSLYVGGGCVIENLPGATWIEDVPYDVTHYNSYAGSAAFVNRGTYLKTNASYAQWLFPFHNESTVGIQRGTLYLTGGGTHVAEFNTAIGASLVFNGGSNVMNPGSLFSGPGTVAVNAGSAEFNTAVGFPGAFNVSGGTANFNPSGTITTLGITNYITGGIVNFTSGEPVPINGLTFYSGTIAGTDVINIAGPFLWQNGFFDGSGVVNLLGASTLQSAFNPYYHYLRGRTVRNHATVRNIYGSFYAGGGSRIENKSGAIWIEDVPYDVTHYNSYAGPATFMNEGAFIKTNSLYSQWLFGFSNAGQTRASQGILYLTGGGTHTGGFTLDSGAAMSFHGGSNTVENGVTFAGQGTLQVGGGTATFQTNLVHTRFAQTAGDALFLAPVNLSVSGNFSGGTALFTNTSTVLSLGATNRVDGGTLVLTTDEPVNFSALTFHSGTIAGRDEINVNGSLLWQNGFFDGTNSVHLRGQTTLQSALSPYWHYLRGRNVKNFGTVNSIYGSFYAGGGTIIENAPGATWVENLPYDNAHYNNYPGSAAFVNRGTLIKSNTFASSFLFPATNLGSIHVRGGNLGFAGNLVQTAGSTFLHSNTLSGGLLELRGGDLTGNGTIIGRLANVGGNVNPGPAPGILSGTHFTNTLGGTVNLKLGGAAAGITHDQIRLSGQAQLDGTLTVSFLNGFTPTVGQSFTVMTFTARSGVFTNLIVPTGLVLQPVYSTTNLVLNAVAFSNVPPIIVSHPASQTVPAGAFVTFNVIATGTEPFTYQWQKNGLALPGATNVALTLPGVVAEDGGFYRITVANGGGSALSSNALLTVNPGFTTVTLTNTGVTGRLHGVYFLNGLYGAIAGQNGTVRLTRDGGQSWFIADTGVTNELFDVQMVGPALWVFGAGGHICVSYDGGGTWIPMATDTNARFRRGAFISPGRGFAVGTGGIYCWNGVSWYYCGGSGLDFYGIHARGGGDGRAWAVGSGGSIWYYNGTGWGQQFSAPGGVTFTGVNFYDDNFGYAVGTGGVIYRTLDGGLHWELINSGVDVDLSGVVFGNGSTIFASGAGGTLLVSGDGGNSWSRLSSGTSSDLNGLAFSGGNGYYVDADGHCYHFTWAPIAINPPPIVTLTAPTNHWTNWACIGLPIAAQASDPNGFITKVEFFADATPAGDDLTRPFAISWTNDTIGEFTLTAVAYDNLGATAVSAPITVTYILPPLHLMIPVGFVGTPVGPGFKLCMTGESGHAYEVLASTNLIDWEAIGLMGSKDELFGYLDRDATNFVHRFYQARQVPAAATRRPQPR